MPIAPLTNYSKNSLPKFVDEFEAEVLNANDARSVAVEGDDDELLEELRPVQIKALVSDALDQRCQRAFLLLKNAFS